MKRSHFFLVDHIARQRQDRFFIVFLVIVLLAWGWLGSGDYEDARRFECAQLSKTWNPILDKCEKEKP